MPGDATRRPLGVFAIVAASALWGTTGTAAAFLPDGIPPLVTGATTFGLGGLLLAITAPRKSVTALREPGARVALTLGAVGVIVYALAFYTGMDLAGVAIGNVVALGSAPAFAAAMEAAVDRRRPTRTWLLSTVCAVVGITLLAIGGGVDAGPSVALGVAAGLAAGAAYALYTVASGRMIAAGTDARGVLGSMFGLAAVPLLVITVAGGRGLVASPPAVAISAYLVIGPMVVAYLLFGSGLRTVRASTATTVSLLEPVVATVLAVAVLHERLAPVGWVGAALVLAGLVVVISASRSPARPPRS